MFADTRNPADAVLRLVLRLANKALTCSVGCTSATRDMSRMTYCNDRMASAATPRAGGGRPFPRRKTNCKRR